MSELRVSQQLMDRDLMAPRAMSGLLPRYESPIVPKRSISGRALVAVVAIMTFLSSLTTGAVMLVRSSAAEWQSEVSREVTIQVRPVQGRDIEADVSRAAEIARATPGMGDARRSDCADAIRRVHADMKHDRRERALCRHWRRSGLHRSNRAWHRPSTLRTREASQPPLP